MKTIFLHGLGQPNTVWEQTTGRLFLQTEIICPDLFSTNTKDVMTYEDVYQDFQDTMESIGEPLNLCGLSLGGVLALHYCIDHPDKVMAAALIAAQYRMPRRLLLLQNAVFHLMPESGFRETGLSKRNMITLTNSMKSIDFSEELSKINIPMVIICGEKDRANLRASEELATLIPGANLHIVKGSGHEINREAPEELAAILNQFFST